MPLAHQTWFEDPAFEADWGFAGETETIFLLATAVLITLLVRLISTRWNGIDIPQLAAMAPYMPFAVRLHLATDVLHRLRATVGDETRTHHHRPPSLRYG